LKQCKKASRFAEPARADATHGLVTSGHHSGSVPVLWYYTSDAKSVPKVEVLNG